jgi:hypothetical protein
MNAQETNAVFRYLLDSISQNQGSIPHDTLPEEIKEDIEFALWMQNVDYSEDSQVKNSLRNALQKNAELVSSASKIRTLQHPVVLEENPPLSLPVWISIIAGSLSIVTATLIVIFSKNKKKLADEQTIQP